MIWPTRICGNHSLTTAPAANAPPRTANGIHATVMVLLLNQPSEESKLFRLTFRHSFFMASAIGLLVTICAYVVPAFVRCGGRILVNGNSCRRSC